MDIFILLVARHFSQTLKVWAQDAKVPAEPAGGLPAIDFDLLTKVTPEAGRSRDGERRVVATPATA
jgi:hypothetical protein